MSLEEDFDNFENELKNMKNDGDKLLENTNNGGNNKVNAGINADVKNIILYGPPGTGKTYNTAKMAVEIIKNIKFKKGTPYKTIKDEYDKLLNKRIKFITFHQSYSYEDFIEGIKPVVINSAATSTTGNTGSGDVKYDIMDGVFKDFCIKADKNCVIRARKNTAVEEEPETNNCEELETNNYVFIIDEINRGNISKIFGELITLIEETKRKDKDEMASATLTYSGDEFSVPDNVYIIGTMNTADRSLAVVDTALRRRFTFIEMMPDPELLTEEVSGTKIDIVVKGVNIREVLEIINKRVTALCDREHTIGHSFFMKLKNGSDIKELGEVFRHKIVPLLQEYFYEDYEKIRRVLGDNQKKDKALEFIQKNSKSYDALFGEVNEEDDEKEPEFYTINKKAFDDSAAYAYLQYANCPELKKD